MEFTTEVFSLFDKKWALVTAGTMDCFNTMTIGWGGLGTLWSKPAATVYVRTSRYTHEFMDRNDYFTVSFFPDDKKKILGVLGTKSGRDMDKMHDSGLTPVVAGESVTFAEAEITLVCKKLFTQRLELERIPADIVQRLYSKDAPHDMYIGEVVSVIRG